MPTLGFKFLLLSLFLCFLFYISTAAEAPSKAQKAPEKYSYKALWYVDKIETVRLEDPEKPFADEIISRGKAVLIENTPVKSKWAAFKKWSPVYFRNILGDSFWVKVFKSPNSTIWLDNPKYSKAANWPSIKDSKYEEVEFGIGDFFDNIIKDPKEVGYYYLSGGIGEYETAELETDVSPTDFFAPSTPLNKRDMKQRKPLWVGTPGVTTQCHYDSSVNFYVQITGHKRFVLIPPLEARNLYLFPRVHYHSRRSQIDFEDIDLSLFPRARKVNKVYEVTLKPGDVLYIPPYWFHHVTNIDGGISFNCWSESEYLSAYMTAKENLPNIKSETPKPVRLLILRKFILGILNTLGIHPQQFVFELYTQRFEPLIKLRDLQNDQVLNGLNQRGIKKEEFEEIAHMKTPAQEKLSTNNEQFYLKIVELKSLCAETVAWSESDPNYGSAVLTRPVQFVANLFRDLKVKEARDIVIGDVLEFVASKAVEEDVRLVGEYFKYCFVFDFEKDKQR